LYRMVTGRAAALDLSEHSRLERKNFVDSENTVSRRPKSSQQNFVGFRTPDSTNAIFRFPAGQLILTVKPRRMAALFSRPSPFTSREFNSSRLFHVRPVLSWHRKTKPPAMKRHVGGLEETRGTRLNRAKLGEDRRRCWRRIPDGVACLFPLPVPVKPGDAESSKTG
jgi:hypothetical protein